MKATSAVPETKLKAILLRLDPELVERLERHAARMRRASPGVSITRLDATRSLLLTALCEAEAAAEVRS